MILFSPGFENPYILRPSPSKKVIFGANVISTRFCTGAPPQICGDDDVGTRSILNERSSHVLVYCSFCLTKKGPTTNPLSQHMRHIFTYGEFF